MTQETTMNEGTEVKVTLAQQLECVLDANACFCIACGQPDEPDLHDRLRCEKPDPFTIANAVDVFDRSCELEPDLNGEARALHCAIVAANNCLATPARTEAITSLVGRYKDALLEIAEHPGLHAGDAAWQRVDIARAALTTETSK